MAGFKILKSDAPYYEVEIEAAGQKYVQNLTFPEMEPDELNARMQAYAEDYEAGLTPPDLAELAARMED